MRKRKPRNPVEIGDGPAAVTGNKTAQSIAQTEVRVRRSGSRNLKHRPGSQKTAVTLHDRLEVRAPAILRLSFISPAVVVCAGVGLRQTRSCAFGGQLE